MNLRIHLMLFLVIFDSKFCVAHNLDGMESMIHLFCVSTILSYERKVKGWWVLNLLCRINILFIVFNVTNITLVHRHEMKVPDCLF